MDICPIESTTNILYYDIYSTLTKISSSTISRILVPDVAVLCTDTKRPQTGSSRSVSFSILVLSVGGPGMS